MKQIKEKLTLDEYIIQKVRDERNSLFFAELKKLGGVKHKSLDIYNEFPHFVNTEVVRFNLNRLDGDILTLDKPYQISKDVIKNLTGLYNVGGVLKKKLIQNIEVEALMRITGDQRALIITTIKDLLARYIAHGISYKIFFRNTEGSTSVGIVYIAHKMIIENEAFDLFGLMKDQLMENTQLTKDIE